MNVKGAATKQIIETELNQYWKAKENILYIGESSSESNGIGKIVKACGCLEVAEHWRVLDKIIIAVRRVVCLSCCLKKKDTEFKVLLHFIEQTTVKSFYELDELGKHLLLQICKLISNRSIPYQEHFKKNQRRKYN